MSIERSFLRYRNRLEKIFGKRKRDRNGNSKEKIPLMESIDTETPIPGAISPSQRLWLTDFLVNAGQENNPFDPNYGIRISLFGDDAEKVHPTLRTPYSTRSRLWRI